jgi:2-oxoglutarate ferredoxin oxidoreductase subunit gamma
MEMTTVMAPTIDLSARERVELCLSGFGGQGIILAGYIVGRAATVHANRCAVMMQNYGPESRGGACMTELVIADSEIAYPRVVSPDLIVVMSQPAYLKYGIDRPDSCLLISDADLVTPDEEAERGRLVLAAPATRLAEELGRRVMANIVMLGFVCGATRLLSYEVMRDAVAASVPAGSDEANLLAFDTGHAAALAQVGGGDAE